MKQQNFLYAIILIILSSCGCNYHLKKAENKCGKTLLTEVVTVRDTIYTERVVKDTLFSFTNSSDTVILKQENLHIKYFYNTHDSTIYIKGECITDTIYKDRVVTINTKSLEFSVSDWIRNKLIWLIAAIVLTYLVIYIFKR